MVANKKDTLMFENYNQFADLKPKVESLNKKNYLMVDIKDDDIIQDCFFQILQRFNATFLERHFGSEFLLHPSWIANYARKIQTESKGYYPRESYMMSFYFASEHLYGLPERANKLQLNITSRTQPYRLWSIDKFPHLEWDNTGLYSGVPYITGHGSDGLQDESVLWMSSAETYVDILDWTPPNSKPGRLVNFISEAGVMEFFMIGSSTPKRLQKLLGTITGFAPIPPLFSLGFHYSRWEKTSARKVVDYNERFEENGFPLDVLWLDLGHTYDNMYFTWNPFTFGEYEIEDMKNALSVSDRKIVVITDPHIKQSELYHVYKRGN